VGLLLTIIINNTNTNNANLTLIILHLYNAMQTQRRMSVATTLSSYKRDGSQAWIENMTVKATCSIYLAFSSAQRHAFSWMQVGVYIYIFHIYLDLCITRTNILNTYSWTFRIIDRS